MFSAAVSIATTGYGSWCCLSTPHWISEYWSIFTFSYQAFVSIFPTVNFVQCSVCTVYNTHATQNFILGNRRWNCCFIVARRFEHCSRILILKLIYPVTVIFFTCILAPFTMSFGPMLDCISLHLLYGFVYWNWKCNSAADKEKVEKVPLKLF